MPILLLCSILIALMLGSVKITPSLLLSGDQTAQIIIFNLRFPRVMAALLAGVGLSVSGVLLQSVTDNELASPNIIGVNSGGGFFCILLLTLFPSYFMLLPFASFIGAFFTTLLIVSVVNKIGSAKSTIILAGIAVTTLLNSAISLFSLIDSDVLSIYNAFSVGGLSGIQLKSIIIPAVIIFICLAISLFLSKEIKLLSLGDELASSLGVRVKFIRLICLVLASASASAVVSFAGLLGFVGLVVPHISRRIVGNDTKKLLVFSAFSGAILVIWADLLGRVLLAPTEIPVGIVMAFIGAPFFFILLLKRRNFHA